ncbi:hypothetical protein [Nocardia sp. NPDC049149]|uniref:hypothetical protein n=1 Tax=Nocardia sp. NPDC049149 TaxID=3364315 RepID=UPI003715DE46
MEMRTIRIPDRTKIEEQFPDNPELHYGRNTEEFLEQLLPIFRGWHTAFGPGSQTDPPTKQQPPEVKGGHSNFEAYETAASKLRDAFFALNQKGEELLPVLRQLREQNTEGVRSIDTLIVRMNASAEKPPNPPKKEDDYILGYVAEALDEGSKAMDKARGVVAGLVGRMPQVNPTGNPNPTLNPPQQSPQVQQPPPQQQPPQQPPQQLPQIPTAQPPSQQPSFQQPPRIPGLDDPTTKPPSNSEALDKVNRAIDNLQNQARNAPPPQSNPPMSPFGSDMGMGGMGGMLGPLVNAMNQRQLADPFMNQRPPDPRRYDQPPPAPPKQQQAAAPPAQQQPAKPGTPTTAQQISNTSSTPNTSNGHPGTTPAKGPNADGKWIFDYPAPDTRSQEVSQTVYDALRVAFADTSGAGAMHAYEKTKAKWTDDKQIGKRVDPNELMTGDVVMWDKRTALLVVFPPDQGGTVEAIVNGEKKPLADLMAKETTAFGEFLGFAHPAGIELAAAKGSNTSMVDPGVAVPAVTTA